MPASVHVHLFIRQFQLGPPPAPAFQPEAACEWIALIYDAPTDGNMTVRERMGLLSRTCR